jgi:hypothetical protein
MSISTKLRREVLNRDNNLCKKCTRDNHLEVHHIQATVYGGSDDIDNLIALCVVCHKEWHSVETQGIIEFDTWITYPPLSLLINGFEVQKEISRKVLALDLLESVRQFMLRTAI